MATAGGPRHAHSQAAYGAPAPLLMEYAYYIEHMFYAVNRSVIAMVGMGSNAPSVPVYRRARGRRSAPKLFSARRIV